MSSKDDVEFAYFVRTSNSRDDVESIFGDVKFLNGNDTAFVTKRLSGSQIEQKLAKLDSVKASIKVLD